MWRSTHRLAALALVPLLLLVAAPQNLACCAAPAMPSCPAGGCCDGMTMESAAAIDCCGTLEAAEPPGSRGSSQLVGPSAAPRIAGGDPLPRLLPDARPARETPATPPPDDLQALYSVFLI